VTKAFLKTGLTHIHREAARPRHKQLVPSSNVETVAQVQPGTLQTWLLIEVTSKYVVFPFLSSPSLPFPSLPSHVVCSCLQDGHQVIGDSHDHVVILFSDIVGFSTMASTMSAVEVFLMLSNLYYAFDRLVDKFGIYKVETIGDGYMLAAGKPS